MMQVLLWKCRLRLLESPSSLKEKRQVVARVLGWARREQNLSCAEVGDLEIWNMAELGFVTVGHDARQLESLRDRVRDRLESHHPVEVVEEEFTIESY